MRKGLVIILCLSLIATAMVIPAPSKALLYDMDQSLARVDASYIGEDGADYAGSSVASAGDVNSDGYDDFLIGAKFDNNGGTDSGSVYLVLGKPSGYSMDTDLSNVNISFRGENANDEAGYSVAGAGDVNSDGYDDFLIGARGDDDGGTWAGQTYLILGHTSGWTSNTNISKANASFWGEDKEDGSGYAVAGAGDVNGDGYDDILIGAPGDEEGGAQSSGQVYLIFGKPSGWAMDTDLSTANASFLDKNQYDGFGSDVAGVGDVNGDGYDDILMSAPGDDDAASGAGATFLFFGKASGWAMHTKVFDADASFLGEKAADESGHFIAGAGDVNDDGYDDFMISAPENDDGADRAGQTYLFFGKASGWAMNTSLSDANASFLGEEKNDCSGWDVAGAGDVNKDGYDDILIGSSGSDVGGASAGQSYLILGKGSNWSMDTNLSKSDASFVGEAMMDYAGMALSGAGDVDGDGFDDIIIGAHGSNNGAGDEGQVYLVLVETYTGPTAVSSLKAYTDDTYSVEESMAPMNDTVFIELKGTDGDPTTNGVALLNVNSSISDKNGFRLRLAETGLNTGVYRGNITVKDSTDALKRWIHASEGELVNITSLQNKTKKVSIPVGDNIWIYPFTDKTNATEDSPYNLHYWTNIPPIQWDFQTNASWLSWNTSSHNLSGSPINSDVGKYYVRINVTNALWGSDEHNFTITVKNVPPVITTFDHNSSDEDRSYSNDYNCSDDGQGSISWHISTNASSWLSFNTTNGMLSGLSVNDDVGDYYVNISVDDGNDGWDFSNFTLTVYNINDPPVMSAQDQLTAIEDSLYSGLYYATDVDKGDRLVWQLATNASSWLKIDPKGGVLTGIPTNDDIGSYWVNVTVKDLAGAYDFHNFTLIVVNTNDPPVIYGDLPNATEGQFYSYNLTASDVDVGDTDLEWNLTSNAKWLVLGPNPGAISGTPSNDDVGVCSLIVTVTDTSGGQGRSYFNISVINVNDPPQWKDVPSDQKLDWTDVFFFDVNATDIDVGDALKYGISSTPTSGLFIDAVSGKIVWTPDIFGPIRVDLTVTDGNVTLKHSFNLTVNNPPIAHLVAPSDSENMSVRNPTLQWTVHDKDGDPVTSDLYLGTNKTAISALSAQARVATMTVNRTYTPTELLLSGQTYYWTVVVHDQTSEKRCVEGVWSFTVPNDGPVNNLPIFTSTPMLEIEVGKVWTYTPVTADIDKDDTVIIKLVVGPTAMVFNANFISWTPTEAQVGNNTVKLEATDGKGSAYQEFVIHVTKKNVIPPPPPDDQAPKLDKIQDMTVTVGEGIQFQIMATDQDNDQLTYSMVGAPAGATMSKYGYFQWEPTTQDVGNVTISVVVSDGKKETQGTFHINVIPKKTHMSSGFQAPWSLLVIIMVVAFVLGSIGAFFALGRNNKTDKKSKTTNPTATGAKGKSSKVPTAGTKTVPRPAKGSQKPEIERKKTAVEKGPAVNETTKEEPKGTKVIEVVDLDDFDKE
jgi:hypothetical protein